MMGSSDPLVNVWDLGADPLLFAQERIQIAKELVQGLAEKTIEHYQKHGINPLFKYIIFSSFSEKE